jgi:exodeoxyribonuclease V alpha subunit
MRQTTLTEKLAGIKETVSDETGLISEAAAENDEIAYEEILTNVDPMIGMEGITPYHFM